MCFHVVTLAPGQWDETVKEQTRENIERYLVYETGLGKQAVLEIFDHLVGCPKHPGRWVPVKQSTLRFAEGLDCVWSWSEGIGAKFRHTVPRSNATPGELRFYFYSQYRTRAERAIVLNNGEDPRLLMLQKVPPNSVGYVATSGKISP